MVLPCSKPHIKFAVSVALLMSTRYPGNAGSNGNLIFKTVCGALSVCEGSFVGVKVGEIVGSIVGVEVGGKFVNVGTIVGGVISVGGISCFAGEHAENSNTSTRIANR